MTTQLFCAIAAALVTTAFAQTPQTAQTPGGAASPRTVTLNGCVGGGANAEPFTLSPLPALPLEVTTPRPVGTSGTLGSSPEIAGYRLTGHDVSPWLGKRVRVVGNLVRPTAPAGASTSATGKTGTSSAKRTVQMPELHVTSVEPVSGSCPEK